MQTASDGYLLDVASSLIGCRLAIVPGVYEVPIHQEEPDFYLFIADYRDPYLFAPRSKVPALNSVDLGLKKEPFIGSGASLSRVSAADAAAGEALERFAAHIYDPEEIIYGRSPPSAVLPTRFIGFSNEQYNRDGFLFQKPQDDSEVGWIAARNARTGESALVPARQVFVGYYSTIGEKLTDFAYSTGVALGTSQIQAKVSALYEVLERDAFMCHWLLDSSPKRLPLDQVKAIGNGRWNELLSDEFEIDVLYLSQPLPVHIIAVALRAKRSNGFSIGAACRADLGTAIEKALLEAWQGLNFVIGSINNGTPLPSLTEVKDFTDHLLYYYSRDSWAPLNKFLSGAFMDKLPPISYGKAASYEELSVALHQQGYDVYEVNLTPSSYVQAGIFVYRVVVPGLHPMSCLPGYEHLDDRRLTKFSSAQGWSQPNGINMALHPFP